MNEEIFRRKLLIDSSAEGNNFPHCSFRFLKVNILILLKVGGRPHVVRIKSLRGVEARTTGKMSSGSKA